MSEDYRVLVVDDDLGQAEMLIEFLSISGFKSVDHVADLHSLWRQIKQADYDIILLDYKLPDGTGLDALDQLSKRGIEIPVVMVTGQGTERVAAQAIQRGAADYMLKSGDYLITMPALIHKTIQAHQIKLGAQRSMEQVRYQALLLNNVRDAVVVWDLAGVITYWNPSASLLYGWTAEERVGRPVAQIYLSAFTPTITLQRENEQSLDGKSVDNKGAEHVVRKYTHPDGRTIWISSRVTALRDATQGNRLIGYMDVSHDITAGVQAEEALRESEARYRAIVEDYQTELISRFKPNGLLTFVNEVYCRYFGLSRNELVGMNFLYFLPENERVRMIQHLSAFAMERPVATLEHQVQIPAQGLRWLQRTDRAMFDDRGRIFEFQSVSRDVTDRKRMESQIQAAQSHLVQAARMATIGEVAGGVAHQIYNPLTTIIADAQILLRSLNTFPAARAAENPNGGSAVHTAVESAQAIEQAGWRLQQVVQRLLEFSRPSGETLEKLQINDTIQNAVSLVSNTLEAAGCLLQVQLDQDLPLVPGNPRQMQSLWVNLLLLARDAVANGAGHNICIESYSPDPDSVTIEISDDGRPIPADQIDTIFEPNFVGPTIGRGTGMELSICREIVRQHAGHITVESQASDTVFYVTLPTAAAINGDPAEEQ